MFWSRQATANAEELVQAMPSCADDRAAAPPRGSRARVGQRRRRLCLSFFGNRERSCLDMIHSAAREPSAFNRASPESEGPSSTLPSVSKREPWQGQSKVW